MHTLHYVAQALASVSASLVLGLQVCANMSRELTICKNPQKPREGSLRKLLADD